MERQEKKLEKNQAKVVNLDRREVLRLLDYVEASLSPLARRHNEFFVI